MRVIVVVACLLALLAPAAGAARLPAAGASDPSVDRAVDYLLGRQQPDGGFAEPEASSSDTLTAWVTCAISSAGIDVRGVRSGGASPLDFLSGRAPSWSKLTDIEKGCLAVCCAGADPRSFGGRDLVAEIKARAAADGHIGDLVNEHCWGLIALAAAGEPAPAGSMEWLSARQNIDGGFGYGAQSGSDPDDTGGALQALIASGADRGSNTVARALSYLMFCQQDDGGFAWQSAGSNVGSTAWAVQGICAAGEDPASQDWTISGNTPVDFIEGMQQPDGHFKYSSGTDTNPVWMTAEAVPAILGTPFPLDLDDEEAEVNTPGQQSPVPGNQATTVAPGGQEAAPGAESDRGSEEPGSLLSELAGRNQGPPGGARYGTAAGGARQAAGGGTTLVVFLVFCGMYMVLLCLLFLVLHIRLGPPGPGGVQPSVRYRHPKSPEALPL
ncbi:MAG: prenyltransferase/squalene oxidase repeat-containing protein [Actinomycetota bacterium]